MEPLKPEVMVSQVEGLAGDLRALTCPFAQQIRTVLTPWEWRAVTKVYLTGDGDSYHASCAAEMAFEAIADVACAPMSAQRFLDYGAAWMRPAGPLALAGGGLGGHGARLGETGHCRGTQRRHRGNAPRPGCVPRAGGGTGGIFTVALPSLCQLRGVLCCGAVGAVVVPN
jgi:hypothetical protein